MSIKLKNNHNENIFFNENTQKYQTYIIVNNDKYLIDEYNLDDLIYRINYYYDKGTLSYNSGKEKHCCVYRYIDKKDNVIKYIGIVYNSTLYRRYYSHLRDDEWAQISDYYVEFFYVDNRTEAEAFESHLISKYKTYKYYNVAKNNWGESKLLNNFNIEWIRFDSQKRYFPEYKTHKYKMSANHYKHIRRHKVTQ